MTMDAGTGGFGVEVDDGVAVVTFDRPPANSFETATYQHLSRIVDRLASDDQVRAVVFASGHDDIFVSGGDIQAMVSYDRRRSASASKVDLVHATFLGVQRLPMPTIAAITGHALGGGCELALCTDFRLMTRGRARIGLPETTLGIVPGGGGTQRLARLVGRGVATEMLMLGRRLDADRAVAVGLVHEACDTPADTTTRSRELAADLAGRAPLALRAVKRALDQGVDGDLAAGLVVEREVVIDVLGTDDAREGATAFVERRDPRFRGR